MASSTSSSKQSPSTIITTATPHRQTPSSSSSSLFSPSPITPIRTLSKNALYTPLSTYLKPTTTTSTTTTTPNKRITSNIKESSLVEFLQQTNNFYQSSSLFQSTNGGSNRIKQQDVESRILQRSIGMLGGTAGGGGVTKKRIRKRRQRPVVFHSVSNKKRKKQLSAAVENNSMLGMMLVQEPFVKHEILVALNAAWNQYARQLVHLLFPPSSSSSTSPRPPTMQHLAKLSSQFQKAELVGAHVQIVNCNSKQHLKEHKGIVVNITACTWHVAMMVVISDNSTVATNKNDEKKEKEKSGEKVKEWKVFVIPKHGTTLALRIPLPTTSEKQMSNDDEAVEKKNKDDDALKANTKGKTRKHECTNIQNENQAKEGKNLCILIHGSSEDINK